MDAFLDDPPRLTGATIRPVENLEPTWSRGYAAEWLLDAWRV